MGNVHNARNNVARSRKYCNGKIIMNFVFLPHYRIKDRNIFKKY